nr:ribonuclease H-like domain-containing protein [Tanacetum cinerariifolium]
MLSEGFGSVQVEWKCTEIDVGVKEKWAEKSAGYFRFDKLPPRWGNDPGRRFRDLASVKEQLVFYKKNEVMFYDQIDVLKRDALFKDSEINALNLQIEKLKKEKESNHIKINNFENAFKSLDKLIGSQITNNSRTCLGFTSYNAVAPPPTGLFAPPTIDLSNSGLEEFQHHEFKGYGPKDSKSVSDSDEDESELMVLKSDNVQHTPEQANQPRKVSQDPRNNRTNWNEMRTQKLGVGFQFTKKACFVCGSFSHLIKDCDFHVLTKSGIIPISIARQSSSKATAPVSAAMPINTAAPKPLVNVAKPIQNALQKSHSLSMRPFYQQTTLKNRNLNNKVNTAKGDPQDALKDQGYFDSGCSRHMTGNISYLTDFKEHDGGYVAFGGGAKGDKITGKGTIKNADESQVLLKVPRKNNMRLGHINFKNINKLVMDNLVRGLPSKRFENDQTYVACLKGKQHKVFFKSKIQNSISQPLFMLHMDLFGPTSQNGVAERRNRTLIEAARTMLADSKLLTTFWAEAVNTACYVQNRVLVVKPYFKILYELYKGRSPALSFMRPFGCHVIIFNTLDQLGNFDGKSDEGIFVGYSTISKAFRVYNTRIRKVEENLHITFLENKPMIADGRPEWLFDIDALSESMNYVPVPAGTNSNDFADGHNKDKYGPSQESECDTQERPNAKSSTKNVNTTGPSINTANANDNTGNLNINTISPPVYTATLTYADYPTDPFMPDLEDTGIFDDSYDDRDEGAEADYNNLDTVISVSPIPSTRVHKGYPKEQIIGEAYSAV